MSELYVENYTPYLGAVVAAIILLPQLLNILLVHDKKKSDKSFKNNIICVLKWLLLFAIVVMLCVNKDILNIKDANAVMGIMLFFYILYYELWIKFIINGRKEEYLYTPFMYVRVPMQLSMSLAILFTSIWAKNVVLIVLSVLFGIVYVFGSYKHYISNFAEYRDLFDDNRKSTGKKILKTRKIPKGLNCVVDVVFMYSPKDKKWLMQKRSKEKGGKWATTGGHPKAGQTSIEGMITEIYEELGIKVEESELEFVLTHKREKHFVDIYYLEKDINIEDIKMQKEEVADVRFMDLEEVDKLYKENKFKKSHYEYLTRFKEAKLKEKNKK